MFKINLIYVTITMRNDKMKYNNTDIIGDVIRDPHFQ